MVLELQKSSYSNFYYLNIKIYVQGYRGQQHVKNKDLVTRGTGNLSRRPPLEYDAPFDLENPMDDATRKKKLEELFIDFLTPFSNKALTKAGLLQLENEGKYYMNETTKKLLSS